MSGRCRRRHAAGLQAGRSLRDNDQKEYLNYAQHGYAGRRKSCGEASSQREGALSGWRWVVRSIRRVQLEGSLRPRAGRSEEHTSELQSLMRTSYAVFCLQKNNKHYKPAIDIETLITNL